MVDEEGSAQILYSDSDSTYSIARNPYFVKPGVRLIYRMNEEGRVFAEGQITQFALTQFVL